jgi:hypothetical protein
VFRKYFLLLLLIWSVTQARSQPRQLVNCCRQFNELNTLVTIGKIDRQKAIGKFQSLIKKIKDGSHIKSNPKWVFPLAGYHSSAIGGIKGNGYHDKGYNYLDGNKHIAHPAHDIFINDKNQDEFDDIAHTTVKVIAVTDGIVIACTNQWSISSTLRGGKYIWLYHPGLNIITYYAHNRSVVVKPGDNIKQGQKIAEVGRTGFNAYKKRSPTHLHFSSFYIKGTVPQPYNCYIALTHASTL